MDKVQQSDYSAKKDILESLKKRADKPADSSDRRVARRVLGGTFIGAIEAARPLMEKKQYNQPAKAWELGLAAAQTDAPGVWFSLAVAFAGTGDKKRSLNALEQALKQRWACETALHRKAPLGRIRCVNCELVTSFAEHSAKLFAGLCADCTANTQPTTQRLGSLPCTTRPAWRTATLRPAAGSVNVSSDLNVHCLLCLLSKQAGGRQQEPACPDVRNEGCSFRNPLTRTTSRPRRCSASFSHSGCSRMLPARCKMGPPPVVCLRLPATAIQSHFDNRDLWRYVRPNS